MNVAIIFSSILLANLFASEASILSGISSASCTACKGVLTALDDLFDPASIDLKKCCEKLTCTEAKKVCLEFAENFEDSFLEIFAALLDPASFCGDMGICS